ncbi:hypothetical protein CEE37_11575 [candidate division LCP-89 bacterium B3_LCP]|uniref:Uncharacterized protein n=1 Tax=candidate division LCP-89 bacterium B3_LCP TaxID=2012998 RepID=A0A532UW94_UNCL8|nr:MAG: hypothetical protein CEE37_11575 [candidate division LCP-89 bacterium B3_LCP]
MASTRHEINPTRLEKLYDYQLALVSRRWQYFATYLAISGLLVSYMPRLLLEDISRGRELDNILYYIYPLIGLIIAIVFTNLVSLATERIVLTEEIIGKGESIVQLGISSNFLGLTVTVLIYFCVYTFSIAWVALAFHLSWWFGLLVLVPLIGNLFLLRK